MGVGITAWELRLPYVISSQHSLTVSVPPPKIRNRYILNDQTTDLFQEDFDRSNIGPSLLDGTLPFTSAPNLQIGHIPRRAMGDSDEVIPPPDDWVRRSDIIASPITEPQYYPLPLSTPTTSERTMIQNNSSAVRMKRAVSFSSQGTTSCKMQLDIKQMTQSFM